MRRVRINQTPIFVTALCACLGLMVAGAASRVHPAASSVLSEMAAATKVNLSYGHSSSQSLRITAAYAPRPLAFALRSESEPSRFLYRNENPLTPRNSILVVTRMPRASLDAVRA